MTTYLYHCAEHGDVELRHPMSEVDQIHTCPTCGAALRRKLVPIHHRWPAQFRPGFEHSGQRMLLDPEYQARKRDELATKKEARANRAEAEQKASEANNVPSSK